MPRESEVIDVNRTPELLTRLSEASRVKIRVGLLGSKAALKAADGPTMATLGAIHEFGTRDGHIPARSFIGATVDDKRAMRGAYESATLLWALGEGLNSIFDAIGLEVVKMMRRRIRGHIPPPNAPSTVRRKGSSTPLIDTGRMLNSIDYEVVK